MKNYYVFTTTLLLIISLIIAGTGAIAFVVIKPVAASDDHDDDFSNIVYRIDHKSGVDKVIHFDSLEDCHDYVEHHPQLQLSIHDCIID
jgi:hypothetical protein